MNLKSLLLILSLLIASVQSYGQICFTESEAKQIARKLIEGRQITELYELQNMELDAISEKVRILTEVIASKDAELIMNSELVMMHKRDNEALKANISIIKRRSMTLVIGCGIVTGGVIFFSIK